MTLMGALTRGQGHYIGRENPYPERANWTPGMHTRRLLDVVQTFRQAVARIVRRAKWRRIINALRLRERVGVIPTFLGRPGSNIFAAPRMWPRVRDPGQASDREVSNYMARFGPTGAGGPNEGALRGTGTRGTLPATRTD